MVVSEDGHINLFPRLRRPIERSSLDGLVQQVRAATRPLSKEVRQICLRLLRDYSVHIPPDVHDAVLHGAFAALPLTDQDDEDDEDDPFSVVYDKHATDIIEDK